MLKDLKFFTYLILIILFISLGFFDLNISKAIYNPDVDWVLFMDRYGVLITPIFIFFGSVSLSKLYIIKNNKRKKSLKFYIAMIIVSLIYICTNLISSFNFSITYFIMFILILWVVCYIIYFVYISKKETLITLENFCRVVVLTGVYSMVTIFVLKLGWGRVRFFNLDSGYSNFTPWYIPQGYNGNHSFPSGHAGNISIIFIFLINSFSIKTKFSDIFIKILVMFLISIFCLSRVILGAHYMSDIIMSVIIVVSYMFLFYNKVYYKIPIKKSLNNFNKNNLSSVNKKNTKTSKISRVDKKIVNKKKLSNKNKIKK